MGRPDRRDSEGEVTEASSTPQSEITRLTSECERLRGENEGLRVEITMIKSSQGFEDYIDSIERKYSDAMKENSKLEALLREIEEHEDCHWNITYEIRACLSDYDRGVEMAHRVCAEITRRRHEK